MWFLPDYFFDRLKHPHRVAARSCRLMEDGRCITEQFLFPHRFKGAADPNTDRDRKTSPFQIDHLTRDVLPDFLSPQVCLTGSSVIKDNAETVRVVPAREIVRPDARTDGFRQRHDNSIQALGIKP